VKGCPVYRSSGSQPKPTYIAIIRSAEEPTLVTATNNKETVTDNNTQDLRRTGILKSNCNGYIIICTDA
jgi:hypothetical protein